MYYSKQNYLKKLLYRSCNRGCKENDILLGDFARRNIEHLTTQELELYEDLLNETDTDIFNWVSYKVQAPAKYKELISSILRASDCYK
jgi:antitoxin CptB